MSIQKYYEIACDTCQSAICHSTADSKDGALDEMVEDGGIIHKRKHFCNIECKKAYKRERS